MTLSSFLLRPALTTLISGGVTDSVVTASPAILLGVVLGGVSAAGTNWDSYITIKNGSTTIINSRNIFSSGYWNVGLIIPSNGIDCPNGITVTTSIVSTAAQDLANSRLTINYILK